MATIELVGGRMVEHVRLTDIKRVGEDGSRSAIVQIDGKMYEVYNSIIDGFSNVWHERIPYEMFKGTSSVVEGSATTKGEEWLR